MVLGMGGSGIAGDVVAAAAAPLLPVPVVGGQVLRVPGLRRRGHLVFAISCSGNTEETLQAASDAALPGASVVAITGGGELAELATAWGAPVIAVPTDIPQPRAALGAMAIPPLVVLEEIGLFRGGRHWIDAGRRPAQAAPGPAGRRRRRRARPPTIARRIGRTFPLIHGGGAVGAAAAQRWKTQVNENAKAPGVLERPARAVPQRGLRLGPARRRHPPADDAGPAAPRRRAPPGRPPLRAGRGAGREVVADVIEVRAEGDGDLAQLFDLILFGDFVSLWMAAQEGSTPARSRSSVDLKAAAGVGAEPAASPACLHCRMGLVRVCGCKSMPVAGETTHVRQPVVAEHGAA